MQPWECELKILHSTWIAMILPPCNRTRLGSAWIAPLSTVLSVVVLLTGFALFTTALSTIAFSPIAFGKPRHGEALGGTPKYPRGFSNYDYANPRAEKGGKLVLSRSINFDTLNPFSLKGRAAPEIGLVFETLMDHALDEVFSQYGLLAETIDIASDGLSVTYTLNPKARFSDGKPVRANDVVFTFNILRSDAAQPFYRFYYRDVKEAKALNARKVRFEFARRNRELALITGELPVLPEHFYGGKDFGRYFSTRALGSGPYTVKKFDFGKYIRYERNGKHWGRNLNVNAGRYNFDQVVALIYRDPVAELEGFKSGEVNWYFVNNSKIWAKNIRGRKWDDGWIVKETLAHGNPSGMQGYAFNIRKTIFKNREVRKALAMALDFEWSNRNLFYGQYTQNDSYFDNSELGAQGLPSREELKLLEPLRDKLPPEVFTVPMGIKPASPPSMRKKLREAKRLLGKNGWKVKDGVLTETSTGLEMRFSITLRQPAFERITEPFIGNLGRLGALVTMKTVDSSVYERKVRTFDYDMIVAGWGASPSPGNEQADFWHSRSAGREGSRNYVGVKDPAVDALVDAVVTATSRARLVTATRALDRALWNGHYVVPHWYIGKFRLTYWNKFGRPRVLPKYNRIGTHLYFWWRDGARDAALKAAMKSGRALKTGG